MFKIDPIARLVTAISFIDSWAEQLQLAVENNDIPTMKYLYPAVKSA